MQPINELLKYVLQPSPRFLSLKFIQLFPPCFPYTSSAVGNLASPRRYEIRNFSSRTEILFFLS